MGAFELKITISADGKTAKLTFPPEVELSAPELENLILMLAKIRGAVKPEFDVTAPQIAPDRLVHDPRWLLLPSAQEEGAFLQIQHHGFGWLQYRLPKRELAKLSSVLATIAGVVEPPTGPKN